jgi:hypothetical protein
MGEQTAMNADRLAVAVLWTLDKSPYIVGGIAMASAYGVDRAPHGVRGAIACVAVLLTFAIAYGAGYCDDLVEEWKAERKAARRL